METQDKWTQLFTQIETRTLDWWREHKTFEALQKKNEGKPPWSFIDGPITANNPMGVHHAWGRTVKDIVQRYHALQGFAQRYQNGFDCQGLWVEVEVEKDLGFGSKKEIQDFGMENFCRQCHARVEKYSAIQTGQSIRLGQWMDWDHSYYTMSDHNIESIWHFLKICHQRGWLYRGQMVLNWCARCGTALSHHEMADSYTEETHLAVYVTARRKDKPEEEFLVWTTTPWTLSANTALAVNPDLTYVRAKQNGRVLILVESRLDVLKGDREIIETFPGSQLIGLRYESLFPDFEVQKGVEHRVIPWKDVQADEGTGIVHIAPGCGREDFILSKEEGIGVIVPINEDGYYGEGFGFLSGMHVTDVRDPVCDRLKESGRLYKTENYQHRYPRCWRCHTEQVFRLDDAWYISCEEIRPLMIRLAEQVEWQPKHIRNLFMDWLQNMQDWNISRKRFWGLPLPFYPCPDCGTMNVIGSRDELEKRAVSGMEGLEELHRPWIDAVKIRCEKCGKTIERVLEVGDCWLDAGIVPYSTLKYFTDRSYWEKWFPSEIVIEMREQTRLWFYALMFMSATIEGKTPYRKVLAYEKVHDEKNKPMHKSHGNAIWFDDAVERMGADVMRWVYASQTISENLRFGYNIADEVRRKLITLWNVVTFYETYAAIDKPDLSEPVPCESLPILDRWLLARANRLIERTTGCYEANDTPALMREMDAFISDLSNWWVRESRDRFWAKGMPTDKKAAYGAIVEALRTLTVVMAPVTPFLTEEIHQRVIRPALPDAPESVHLSDFPKPDPRWENETLLRDMETVRTVVTLGLNARNAESLRVRQPLRKMWVFVKGGRVDLEPYRDLILGELNVKEVGQMEDPSKVYSVSAKPNFKSAGQKLGKAVKAFGEWLKTANASEIRAGLEEKGSVTVELEAGSFELAMEDFLFESAGREGYAVAEEAGILVALETELTEELILEGLARDLVRAIQDLRKAADFEILDRIRVYYESDDSRVKAALEAHREYILHETLGNELTEGIPDGAESKAAKVGGASVKVGVRKA